MLLQKLIYDRKLWHKNTIVKFYFQKQLKRSTISKKSYNKKTFAKLYFYQGTPQKVQK